MTAAHDPSNGRGHPWPHYPDLAGKVAAVTGGSQSLGAAARRALAANGPAVAVDDRDRAAIDSTVREITGSGGQAIPAPADRTNPAELAAMADHVNDTIGPVDVLRLRRRRRAAGPQVRVL
jgi:NAD(P)-dependent dehydrogenase (short-subunit alcohol dehydrogenase family)